MARTLVDKLRKDVRQLVLGHKSDSESYINYYRNKGARIGEGTIVFQPRHTVIDETRPFLIDIGKNVMITYGVVILTHGYDWGVVKGKHGEVLGSAGKVTIGDNVFIGVNTTILKGVTIGSNVVIGANSLVNKDVPDNTVYAGNPAKCVMSLDEYYEKRKNAQISEAQCVYDEYVKVYGNEPPEEIFDEFFWLFHPRNTGLNQRFLKQMRNMGNFDRSMSIFQSSEPLFRDYTHFLEELRRK